MTRLSLEDHPAILTTGAWAFIESLSALHGRSSSTDFVGYLDGRANAWGWSKDKKKEVHLSLAYIQQHGNAQKHSAVYSAIDARNLYNHFAILDSLLTKIASECEPGAPTR